MSRPIGLGFYALERKRMDASADLVCEPANPRRKPSTENGLRAAIKKPPMWGLRDLVRKAGLEPAQP